MNDPIFLQAIEAIDQGDSTFFASYPNGNLGESKDEEGGWTLLHYACHQFNPDIVAALLQKHNANPNAADHFGEVPLHLAAKVNDVKALNLLLEHNADPFQCNFQGRTALNFATCHGSIGCAEVLLKLSLADEKERNKKSFHLLLFDCIEYRQIELLDLYLNHGLNKLIRDENGYNLTHIAIINGEAEILQRLIECNVPIEPLPDHDDRSLENLATTKRIKKILRSANKFT